MGNLCWSKTSTSVPSTPCGERLREGPRHMQQTWVASRLQQWEMHACEEGTFSIGCSFKCPWVGSFGFLKATELTRGCLQCLSTQTPKGNVLYCRILYLFKGKSVKFLPAFMSVPCDDDLCDENQGFPLRFPHCYQFTTDTVEGSQERCCLNTYKSYLPLLKAKYTQKKLNTNI